MITRLHLRGSGKYVFLVLASVVTLAPLVVVALTAFFKPGEPVSGISLPHGLNWSTFSYAWRSGEFSSAFRTSTIIAAVVVLVVTAFSISAGYALGTMRFRGSKALLYVFMAGICTPYVALVVPMYFQFQKLHILGSIWALILPECGLYLGFGVFWMHSFFVSVPVSLIEAARLDGANSFQILTRVLLPIAKPAVTTLMTLTFFSSWNEYLVPLVLGTGGQSQTVSLGLASFQGQHLTDIPSLAAASLIVAAPAVLIYLLTQRAFFHGLLEGAIK